MSFPHDLMGPPHFACWLDDENRWMLSWRTADGKIKRRAFGNRKDLHDAMLPMFAEVRGIAWPSIKVPDETIIATVPKRRSSDGLD